MKTIHSFRFENAGFFIDLTDQKAAVVIDPISAGGRVQLHEGKGKDRMNGASIRVKEFNAYPVEVEGRKNCGRLTVSFYAFGGRLLKDYNLGVYRHLSALERLAVLLNNLVVQPSDNTTSQTTKDFQTKSSSPDPINPKVVVPEETSTENIAAVMHQTMSGHASTAYLAATVTNGRFSHTISSD
ncbi:MAG TPA: hypothetical protein VGB77_14890 [Abditibacteriaceae bacterium]|jgi:hypothetical protein